MGPELLQHTGKSENFDSDFFMKFVEFRGELIADRNSPAHPHTMPYNTYAVKCIIRIKPSDPNSHGPDERLTGSEKWVPRP